MPDQFPLLKMVLPTAPAPRRLPRGKDLERLILASQFGVALFKISNGAKILPGGRSVHTRVPLDFSGTYFGGRALMFDAKQSKRGKSLETSEAHFPEHQRENIVHFGALGVVAGLLVENTADRMLYWVPWWMLLKRQASLPWIELVSLGTSARAITAERWEKIRSVNERPAGGGL